MEIIVSQVQARVPVTVFRIVGQVNADSSPQLQAEVEKAIKAGARYLLLDLTETSYISSAGLRVLAYLMVLMRKWSDEGQGARGKARDSGQKSPYLKVANPSPDVERVLITVGFDLFLDTHHDYEEALKAF
jgi:anti-anti-sigma factor